MPCFPIALYKRHKWMLTLGIVLAIVTCCSIGRLTLSGWFLSASPWRGLPGPTASTTCFRRRGVRGTAITRTAGRQY